MEKILGKISDRFNSDINEPVIICGDLNVFDTSRPDIYNDPKDKDATKVYEESIGKALEAGFYKFYKDYNPTRADITYHAWDNPNNLPSDESWGI